MTEKKGFVESHPRISVIGYLLGVVLTLAILLNPEVQNALLGVQPKLEVGQAYHITQFSDVTGQQRLTPQGMVTFHEFTIEWKPGKNASWSLPESGFTIVPSSEVKATDCTITLLTEYTAKIAVPLEGATACY